MLVRITMIKLPKNHIPKIYIIKEYEDVTLSGTQNTHYLENNMVKIKKLKIG
ncbi:hypothetical protein HNP68_001060 [Borrelia yangtzensis]|uniref:Uncharacterized protein n=1 Tax=Borreliella yangtzensis TaxID=683292 RepID=A0ABR6PAZ2_9SPIR|nr:hypothetical protein [Borreliella yangtzensis]